MLGLDALVVDELEALILSHPTVSRVGPVPPGEIARSFAQLSLPHATLMGHWWSGHARTKPL